MRVLALVLLTLLAEVILANLECENVDNKEEQHERPRYLQPEDYIFLSDGKITVPENPIGPIQVIVPCGDGEGLKPCGMWKEYISTNSITVDNDDDRE